MSACHQIPSNATNTHDDTQTIPSFLSRSRQPSPTLPMTTLPHPYENAHQAYVIHPDVLATFAMSTADDDVWADDEAWAAAAQAYDEEPIIARMEDFTLAHGPPWTEQSATTTFCETHQQPFEICEDFLPHHEEEPQTQRPLRLKVHISTSTTTTTDEDDARPEACVVARDCDTLEGE